MSPKTAAQPKEGKAKPEKKTTKPEAIDPGTLVDALRLRDDHSMRLMLIQRPDLVHRIFLPSLRPLLLLALQQ